MAPRLSHPDQPFPLRAVLRLYEFLASLKLAVVLILSLALVLAWATFVESHLGTKAAQFLVYHSRGFMLLLALLFANVFCAAAIRYPWKKHQTGFVITHLGLLTLLAGSALSSKGNVNSQMLVFENDFSRSAIDHDEGHLLFDGLPGRPEPLDFRFAPGPFNWSDLAPWPVTRKLKGIFGQDDPSQPWVHPPEVVFENGQVKVEIVDFLSRSKLKQVPYLGLKFRQSVLGFELPVDVEYDPETSFGTADFQGLGSLMLWRTEREPTLDKESGKTKVLTEAERAADAKRQAAEFEAFRIAVPERTVEGDGVVVVVSRGEVHHLPVSQMRARKEAGDGAYDLGDGRTVELVTYAPAANIRSLVGGGRLTSLGDEPRMPAVEVLVKDADAKTDAGAPRTAYEVRFARFPFTPQKHALPDLHVEFYHPETGGRIDLLEGPEGQVAYRVWQKKTARVVGAGVLEEGVAVDTWSMGGGDAVWRMTLEVHATASDPRFLRPSSDPVHERFRVIPLPFVKDTKNDELEGIAQRTRIRISWPDPQQSQGPWKSEDFWLRQRRPEPWPDYVSLVSRGTDHDLPGVHEVKVSDTETVRTTYNVKETDVGCTYKLVGFDLDVDPGTTTAANYTSRLVQIDVRNDAEVVELRRAMERIPEKDRDAKQAAREKWQAEMQRRTEALLEKLKGADQERIDRLVADDARLAKYTVTMNRTLDYPDLGGRMLRYFQENYYPPRSLRAELGSVFRVNRDPGRFTKQLGSALIVLGIFLMFYMRAYFFKPVVRHAPGATTEPESNSGKPVSHAHPAKVLA